MFFVNILGVFYTEGAWNGILYDIGLFCKDIGLFYVEGEWNDPTCVQFTGLFCSDTGLFCRDMGLLCTEIHRFCGQLLAVC